MLVRDQHRGWEWLTHWRERSRSWQVCLKGCQEVLPTVHSGPRAVVWMWLLPHRLVSKMFGSHCGYIEEVGPNGRRSDGGQHP